MLDVSVLLYYFDKGTSNISCYLCDLKLLSPKRKKIDAWRENEDCQLLLAKLFR